VLDTTIHIHTYIRKGPDCDYDKRNISEIICNKGIPMRLIKVMVAP